MEYVLITNIAHILCMEPISVGDVPLTFQYDLDKLIQDSLRTDDSTKSVTITALSHVVAQALLFVNFGGKPKQNTYFSSSKDLIHFSSHSYTNFLPLHILLVQTYHFLLDWTYPVTLALIFSCDSICATLLGNKFSTFHYMYISTYFLWAVSHCFCLEVEGHNESNSVPKSKTMQPSNL